MKLKSMVKALALSGVLVFGACINSNDDKNTPIDPDAAIPVTDIGQLIGRWNLDAVALRGGLNKDFDTATPPSVLDRSFYMAGRGEFLQLNANGTYSTSLTDGFDEGYVEAMMEMEFGTVNRMWYIGNPAEPDSGRWWFSTDTLFLTGNMSSDTISALPRRVGAELYLVIPSRTLYWAPLGDFDIIYRGKFAGP